MKLFMIATFLFTSALFAQEETYHVSYQDKGAVIKHQNCRLIIRAEENQKKSHFLSPNLKSQLALKGYRAYEISNEIFENYFTSKDVKINDLSLSISTKHFERTHSHEADLEIVTNNELKINYKKLPEFNKFEGHAFKKIRFKGEESNSNIGYGASTTKGSEALATLYSSLPDCISLSSGHHYNIGDNYDVNIAKIEIDSCANYYFKKWTTIPTVGPSETIYPLSGLGVTLGVLSMNPIVLTGLGGFGAYLFLRHEIVRHKARRTFENQFFFRYISRVCLSGREDCVEDKNDPNSFIKVFPKSTQKLLNKYLATMSLKEFSVKLSDYLSTSRVCSENAKVGSLNSILKDMSKTL